MGNEAIKKRLAFIVIIISLAATFYCFSRQAVMNSRNQQMDFKVQCFTSIACGGLKHYKEKVRPAWRGRLFSNALGNLFSVACGINCDMSKTGKTTLKNIKKFSNSVAAYNAIWFLAALFFVAYFIKDKLLTIFGFFACMMYAFTPAADNLIQPWDGPALFFYTIILLVSVTKQRNLILFIVPIAVGFKETVLVLALLPMFWSDMDLTERIKKTMIIFISGAAIKFILDIIAGCPIPFFTMQTGYERLNRYGHHWSVVQNIDFLLQGKINHPLFTVGGLLFALFLTPMQKGFKIIAGIHITAVFFFCVINESRLFHELIPLYFIGREGYRVAGPIQEADR